MGLVDIGKSKGKGLDASGSFGLDTGGGGGGKSDTDAPTWGDEPAWDTWDSNWGTDLSSEDPAGVGAGDGSFGSISGEPSIDSGTGVAGWAAARPLPSTPRPLGGVNASKGTSDLGKGRSSFDSAKGNFDGGKGGIASFDSSMGTFDNKGAFGGGKGSFDGPSAFDRGKGGFDTGKGALDPNFDDGNMGGSVASKGSFDSGKGTFDSSKGNPNGAKGVFDYGKGGFDSGKFGFDGSTGVLGGTPGDFSQGGAALDGSKGAFGGAKGMEVLGKGDPAVGAKGSFSAKGGELGCFGKSGGCAPGRPELSTIVRPSTMGAPAPPPLAFGSGKGAASSQPARSLGMPSFGALSGSKGAELTRGPLPQMTAAPRLPGFAGKGVQQKGVGQVLLGSGPAGGLGNAFTVTRPSQVTLHSHPPAPSTPGVRGVSSQYQGGAPPPPSFPPPGGLLNGPLTPQLVRTLAPALANLVPRLASIVPGQGAALQQVTGRPPAPAALALANTPHSAELAPELAALAEAQGPNDADLKVGGPGAAPVVEKKPRILLLITRLPSKMKEGDMQQILEQCGEVHVWRRGRGANSELLSFGFAQFGDPEAAWKASTCLAKQVLCGQEIKVMVEESAESLIQQWRASQQAELKLNTAEELEWELERKAVSCKAAISNKVEELYGPVEGEGESRGGAQRRQELRERENARLQRFQERKAWRSAEFAKELARVESHEKRRRREERDRDTADRVREESEAGDQDATRGAKNEDNTSGGAFGRGTSDNNELLDLVDRVQAEPRSEIFKVELDMNHFRNEKTFEKKLRPWLEKKVDLFMGGPQSDLVEYILRRVNASVSPDALIGDLTKFLDEDADLLVERIWRMLVFELYRCGLALGGPDAEQGVRLGPHGA